MDKSVKYGCVVVVFHREDIDSDYAVFNEMTIADAIEDVIAFNVEEILEDSDYTTREECEDLIHIDQVFTSDSFITGHYQ